MTSKSKSAKRRYEAGREARRELELQFQNRKGPGGTDLDVNEAMCWFPSLTLAPASYADEIPPHCDVLVGYADFTFWLCDVEVSIQPGFYFGNIVDDLPTNGANLCNEQNIGFERKHVMRVRTDNDQSIRQSHALHHSCTA